MMNCKEAAVLMSQAMDRRLGWTERAALRLHLLICAGCANYRAQLDVLRRACRRFTDRGPR